MAAATGPRKTISIHDYPEHLNPFREDDNHNKIRFWTIGRRLSRTNSINFSGIKDLKNSWAFRSFMKKGKRGQQASSHENKTNQMNGEASPIVYRRAIQYSSSSTAGARSTVGSPERADRYVYGGSVTPLPRSRFQERLRSTSQQEVSALSTPRMARSEISGSRLSVESNNPFDEGPVPPVRASRRKKKRAPPPPPGTGAADISVASENSELQISKIEENKVTSPGADTDIDDELKLNVELKIVEDEDIKSEKAATAPSVETGCIKETVNVNVHSEPKDTDTELKEDKKISAVVKNKTENKFKNADSEEDILNSVSFQKIDIAKYRRNSSVNDDDIRLRRGNLEDFHSLSTKRSKSLTNAFDTTYITYDINLNENSTIKDKNGNDEPKKVICKLDETARKQSIDNSISSTEKEFLEIDKVRREFEREINKLNAALAEDDFSATATGTRVSVSDIKRKFDKSDISSPNPIPKPRRSHHSDSGSPVNGNVQTQLY